MTDDVAPDGVPASPVSRGLRRGVYVLPTLFTVGNIFCGYLCVVRTFQGDFGTAALLLFAAALCDSLDGRIARMTKSTSEFGEQYDSLCDVVSFGLAPALLAWRWGMTGLGRWGFVAAFVFLVCGSMRLARFNIMVHRVDKRWFVGLPIPAGAGVVASIVFWHPESLAIAFPDDTRFQAGWAIIVVATAFLMISTLRYRSFKDIDLKKRKSAGVVLFIALILALIAAEPERTLAAVAVVYAASAPVSRLFSFARRPFDRTPTA